MSTFIHADIKEWNKIIYMLCIGVTGVLLLYGVWGEPVQGAVVLVSVLLWLLLFAWMKKNSSGYLLFFGIWLVAAGAALYLYRSGREMEEYLLFLGLEAVALGCGTAAWLCSRYFPVKLLVLLAEIAGMVYCGITGILLPKWGICMGLLCVLMLLTELTEKGTKRKGGLEPLLMVPVFACLLFGLMMLPAKETPAEWKALKVAWEFAKEKADAVTAWAEYLSEGGEKTSSLSFAGYQEGNALAGTIFEGNEPQISVQVDQMKTSLYITGSIYDSYTGSGWEHTAETGETYEYPYYAICSALEKSTYSTEEIREMTRLRSGEIEYVGIHTKTLFVPMLARWVTLPDGGKTVNAGNGYLRLRRAQGVGYAYQVTFLELDYGNENMERLLRQEAWKETPVLTEEEQELRDNIYEAYTALPETLPERIYTLTDEITQGLDNDYDKLRAIEAYLKQFEYSTEIEALPEGEDPVDYFLFETQSGYCTYFASAMTILGRCVGIPVRYVEGFATDAVTKQGRETLMMTGNEAHAWAEGYIENVGWIPLEATPGYTIYSGEAWEKTPTEVNAGEMENPILGASEQDGQTGDTEMLPEDAPDSTEEILVKAVVLAGKLIFGLLVLAGIFALMIWGRRIFDKKKYLASSELEKWKVLLKQVLLIGHLYGSDMKDGETLGAFGETVGKRLDTEHAAFAQFCTQYEAVRYGSHAGETEQGQAALHEAEQYVQELEKEYILGSSYVKRIFYYIK